MLEHCRYYRGPPGYPVIDRIAIIPYQGDSKRLQRPFAWNRYPNPYSPERAVYALVLALARLLYIHPVKSCPNENRLIPPTLMLLCYIGVAIF